MVGEAWPGLKIQQLVPPKGMELLIGWSQQPASTSRLVDKTNANKNNLRTEYAKFLADSRKCVLQMIRGFEEANIALIQKQIGINRRLLQHFAAINNIAIEIPRLTELIEIANKFGGAAKTSGAGNGDCGIVIVNKDTDIDRLRKEWVKNDILPLEFHIHQSELTY